MADNERPQDSEVPQAPPVATRKQAASPWPGRIAGIVVIISILAIGLAPWCLRRGQMLQGLSMFVLLLAAYLLWHQAAAWILDTPLTQAPLLLTGLALLLFVGLYLLQALILARPQGALSQRLYPLAFAGFYLDEYFTRLTFRLWPVRSPQPLTSPTGDRP